MTNTPDLTSPEAVERLIVWLMDAHETGNTEKNPEVWRTLEALSAALHDVRSEYDDFRQRKERPMADQDTNHHAPEQVERLAKTCEGASAIAGRRRFKAQHAHHKNCAATLRALSADRDAIKGERDRWSFRADGEKARAEAAEAERDTLKDDLEFMKASRNGWMDEAQSARAELTALKAALAEAVGVLQMVVGGVVYVAADGFSKPHETEQSRIARAFLTSHQKEKDT